LSARQLLLFLAAACLCQAPPGRAAEPTAPAAPTGEPQATLLVTDLVQGIGDVALPGMNAIVHYTGWLYDAAAPDQRGRKFDSSHDRGRPLSFPLGAGRVIRGWDQGIVGMKVGGTRRLVIPPDFGYGGRNIGNGLIPPFSTLLFEIELLAVETVTLTEQQ
jgi:FKBP-type peptidyl-prolyl cis-trans isomerase